MINVIVSMTNSNTVQELYNTLNSFDILSAAVLIVKSPEVQLERTEMLDCASVKILDSDEPNSTHANNFYMGAFNASEVANILTFVKAGDVFCGRDIFPMVEQGFDNDIRLNTIRTQVRHEVNCNLYTSSSIAIQGWFFKKEFLEYYTFLKLFQEDVEFALNLAYIANLNPTTHLELNVDGVFITNLFGDVGNACIHYFNDILPQQNFFNSRLGVVFIYDILCDCYISYIQVINEELAEEIVDIVWNTIQAFYNYFVQLELDNLDILLQIYNKKMQIIYNRPLVDAFTKKIPSVSLVEFLNLYNKSEE